MSFDQMRAGLQGAAPVEGGGSGADWRGGAASDR